MKLSVLLITYNQEKYIEQTLRSILMQKTLFDFNIIVADDASSDNTLEIIEQLAKDSDLEFIFLEKKHNLGYVKNYQRAFAACTGDYITIMEGDDYWSSEDHLQSHANILDKHTEYSMCFNRHIRLFETKQTEEIPEWKDDESRILYTMKDMIQGNKIGNLSCCTFRNKLIKKLPFQIFDHSIADWFLGMFMTQFGSLAYLKEITSTYRIHDKGQWSKMQEEEKAMGMINSLKFYDSFFDYKYHKEFAKKIKSLEICLYGDKSTRGLIKRITPEFIRKIYRKL